MDVRPTRRGFLVAAAGAALAAACGRESEGSRAPTTSAPPQITITPTTQSTTETASARFVDRGSATSDRVALTFHTNGDLALAQQLLDITVQRAVPITCFVVGEWLQANPDWAAKLVGAGHELANHTYTHPDVSRLDHDQLATEIDRCRDVLVSLTGEPGTFFRPSGTADGTATPSEPILAASSTSGYDTVLGFDVDPLDYQDPGATAVTSRTLDAVEPGSIVSLHFGHVGTVRALPAILDGLAAMHLEPVTASALLA